MLVGYARVSSTGQSLDLQIEALEAAGCQKVHSEKASGRSTNERTQLDRALDQLRDGDTLIVTRLDRLARSVGANFLPLPVNVAEVSHLVKRHFPYRPPFPTRFPDF